MKFECLFIQCKTCIDNRCLLLAWCPCQYIVTRNVFSVYWLKCKGPLSLSKFSLSKIYFEKVFDGTFIVTTVKEIFDQKLWPTLMKTQCHCRSFCRRYGFPKFGILSLYQWSHFLKEHLECWFVHSKIISELVRVYSVQFFKKCIVCASLFPRSASATKI